MAASEFIIDVSEIDFEYQVLDYSKKVPVVVDFWAEWCGPCKMLGPVLEKLTHKSRGTFRLAKVNVDENPNLSMRYNIRSIPAVKAFRDGIVVSEFAGVQPEPKIREFLREIAPDQTDLQLEKGLSLLSLKQPAESEVAFREVLANSPENSTAQLGLVRSLLFQGKGSEGLAEMNQIHDNKVYTSVERLRPLAENLDKFETSGTIFSSENHLDAAYNNAIRLVNLGNLEAAMDGLLGILRQDKDYRDGLARLTLVAILEAIGENTKLANEYRRELASVIF
jgi:putative thioredoxin